MDDLAGLNWSPGSSSNANKPSPAPLGALYGSSGPTPPALSGRSTPLSALASGNRNGPPTGASSSTKSNTPANDSFSNLVSFGHSKTPNNLSLQEQQKRLQEQKAKQEAEKRKLLDAQFGANDHQFWGGLENGRGTPASTAASIASPPASSGTPVSVSNTASSTQLPWTALNGDGQRVQHASGEEGDLLAAFSSTAPVDASTHFPPPSSSTAFSPADAKISAASSSRASPSQAGWNPQPGLLNDDDDDDDPFGLNHLKKPERPVSTPPIQSAGDDEDDILGLLGKPVSEIPPPKRRSPPPVLKEEVEPAAPPANESDKGVAELVDMGFPADKAKLALEETGNDVQSAVGWLLNKAHEEARQKTLQKSGSRTQPERQGHRTGESERDRETERPRRRDDRENASTPAWMRQERRRSPPKRSSGDNTPSEGEKDIAHYASEIGVSLFKSANTLWKTGQKRVQAAVAEFQHESDPGQPKWMRDAQLEARMRKDTRSQPSDQRQRSDEAGNGMRANQPSRSVADKQRSITDEVLMLESGGVRPQSRRPTPSENRHEARSVPPQSDFERPSTLRESGSDRPASQPRFLQQHQQQRQEPRTVAKLSRQAVEEQSAHAYVSPARRRKATPKIDDRETDLLGDGKAKIQPPASAVSAPPLQSNNPFLPKSTAAPTSSSSNSTRTSTPLPTRPKAPPRQIPQVSSQAISDSATHRGIGTEAFKRGDYASAQESYSRALSPLPQTHPIAIIILCNRALTNLKIGDPKASVADADLALSIIGVSRGAGEKIDLGSNEGQKEMAEFFGKALMRKAEALEQMERWKEAGNVWREAVSAGVGGANSIQGRNRCDKALGGVAASSSSSPSSSAPARPSSTPAVVKKPSAPRTATPVARSPATPAQPSAAVNLLRAANAAAEKADDEKFALAEQVDARILAWRGGKQDNLRALIGSLDTVLWPEAGWKKVGMHELVMPNKVKIAYMKGIAKVHPDKLSASATTEQRMISATVFGTLNEAWDKFKKENNL